MLVVRKWDPKATYLRKYGPHFNEKLLNFAVSKMETLNDKGEKSKLIPITKVELDNLLNQNKITLENNKELDYMYVADMCKSDFLRSSIPDGIQLCKYVKDVIDDIDGYDGFIFYRWLADMNGKKEKIEWNEMI